MKTLIALLTLAATASAFSQGLINFNNRVASVELTAPIYYTASGPRGDTGNTKINGAGRGLNFYGLDFGGLYARAALYGGPAGTAEANLVLLAPAVSFKSGSLAGLVDTTATSRSVPGVQPGQPAVLQVRAWDAGIAVDTYEQVCALRSPYYIGKSALINVPQLGGDTFLTPNLGGNTSATDGSAWGLMPFGITCLIPEPSSITLGILGAVAGFFVFRRRK